MILYTAEEVGKLIKAWEKFYEEKHGSFPCDFMPPRLEGLEVELLAYRSDENIQASTTKEKKK